MSLQLDRCHVTFSIYRGIRIKPRWNKELIRVDMTDMVNKDLNYVENNIEDIIFNWDEAGDPSDDSDYDLCDVSCCCDSCAIGVSDFEELEEEITTNSSYDIKYFTHLISCTEWNKSTIIIKGTKWTTYLFKNKLIYDDILQDMSNMKKYCKDNKIKPCWV